jgi:hypothetical protein
VGKFSAAGAGIGWKSGLFLALCWLASCGLATPKEEKMTIDVARRFLMWCTIVDYGILSVWFGAFVFAHDLMQSVHGRWFQLSRNQFDAIHYGGMSIFKIGIMLFNLVPFVVLSTLR